MAYACDTCGKVMASEGGMEVHQAAHRAEVAREVAREDAARRAEEAAAAVPAPVSRGAGPSFGPSPGAPGTVLVLGAAVLFLFVAGLIGAANPHLIAKKHGQKVTAAAAPGVRIPSTSTTVIPPGFRVANNGHGFSLAVPGEWQDIDPLHQNLDQALAAARKANPKLAQVMGSLNFDRTTMKFLSMDVTTGNNVLVQDLGPESGQVADFPAAELEAVFRKAGATAVSHELTTIPAGPAMKFTITLPFGALTDHATAYIVVVHGEAYTLTLTNFQAVEPPAFATLVQTFKVG